jgi:CRP-like cAMP-binding protein
LVRKLDKMGRYSYVELQNIFNQGKIRLFQPGEKIFSLGDLSPDLFVILYGTVKATVLRGEAGKFVSVIL